MIAALHDAQGGTVQLRLAHGAFPTSLSTEGQLERDDDAEGGSPLAGWYVVIGAQNDGDVGVAVVDLGLDAYPEVDVEIDDDEGADTVVATTAGGARLELVAVGSADER